MFGGHFMLQSVSEYFVSKEEMYTFVFNSQTKILPSPPLHFIVVRQPWPVLQALSLGGGETYKT